MDALDLTRAAGLNDDLGFALWEGWAELRACGVPVPAFDEYLKQYVLNRATKEN